MASQDLFLIITPIAIISFLSFKKIFLDYDYKISNSIFEKSWIISLIILLVSQMVDVQYFDGRISYSFGFYFQDQEI